MTAGAFNRATLYIAETGQQVELNGVQEISIAEEVIAEKPRETEIDFEREITGSFTVTDQTALLMLKLMTKSWAGIVPRIRIKKHLWPWGGVEA